MSRKDMECYCVGSAGAVALKPSPAIFPQVKTRLSFPVALKGFGAESLRRWIAWADLLSQEATSKWWPYRVVGNPIWGDCSALGSSLDGAPTTGEVPSGHLPPLFLHNFSSSPLPPAPLDDRLREVSVLLSSVLSTGEQAPLSFCTCLPCVLIPLPQPCRSHSPRRSPGWDTCSVK